MEGFRLASPSFKAVFVASSLFDVSIVHQKHIGIIYWGLIKTHWIYIINHLYYIINYYIILLLYYYYQRIVKGVLTRDHMFSILLRSQDFIGLDTCLSIMRVALLNFFFL